MGKDTSLSLSPPTNAEMRALLEISGQEMRTADYLRIVDHLNELSRVSNRDNLRFLAKKMHSAFYDAPSNFEKTGLAGSLYIDAAIGEGEPIVRPFLHQARIDLDSLLQKVSLLLRQSQSLFPWPSKLENLAQTLELSDLYIGWVSEKLPSLPLPENLKDTLRKAMDGAYKNFRPRVWNNILRMQEAKSLADLLRAISLAAQDFEVNIPDEQRDMLEQGMLLAGKVQAMRSAQDALTVLVEIWKSLDENGRDLVKKASPDLYDFFHGKSDSELNCLASVICLNPILFISKPFILAKISDYGVPKIAAQIDEASRSFVMNAVLEAIARFLPQAPLLVESKIRSEADKYRVLLDEVSMDFAGFGRRRVQAWARSRFPVELRGIEPESVTVIMKDGMISAKSPANFQNGIFSGGEAIGLGIGLASSFLPENPEARKSALLEPVAKLLAMGGFRQGEGKIFPSLLFSLDGEPRQLFDIHHLLDGNLSFAVPDRFRARAGILMNRTSVRPDASVAAQAELLRGIARELSFLRDWEKNEWDQELSSHQIGELVPELPPGSIVEPVFPKPMAFALALGNAGAILQNVTRKLSPAFLWLRGGEIFWGDRYKTIDGANVSTVAGLVSILNGKRSNIVQSGDVAKYVLALDELLRATEGVEHTEAPPIKERTAKGRTVLEELLEARRYLRLFQMALTNYLVYVVQEKDGTIAATRDLSQLGKPTLEPPRLEDQALAIRALLASARSLELPLLRWAALDTYYGMNRRFFDSKRQFYMSTPGGGFPSLRDLTLTLLAGEELAPNMPTDVYRQWRKVSGPWVSAMGDL